MRNILFLCTGNSARSILAETYMNHQGAGQWSAFSAGSKPVGTPNPFALKTLKNHGMAAPNASSKSWNIFANEDAPFMSVIVTVCDNAAGETCPVWPTIDGGTPQIRHWSFPDPAAATGSEEVILAQFETVFKDIRTRIDALIAEYDP